MTFRVSELELFNDVRGSQRKLFIHGHVVHLRTEELDLPLTLHTTSSHELEIFKGKIPLLVPLTLRYLLRTPILAEGIAPPLDLGGTAGPTGRPRAATDLIS